MRKFIYKGQQVLLKELGNLPDMTLNRVRRLLEHHKITEGGDVSEIMNIKAWHQISTRKTGGKYLFRGKRLTPTEISSEISLGIPSTHKRIFNAKINIEEDVTELFSEFGALPSSSFLDIHANIKVLMSKKAMHPIKAWLDDKGLTSDDLKNYLRVNETGGYSIFSAKRPSAKRIERVSLFLGITQASLRQSFTYYNDLLAKREVMYSKLVLERLSMLPAHEITILPNKFIDCLCDGIRPIEAMRKNLSLTNQEFALQINVSSQSISRIKKTLIPYEKTLHSLSKVSGIEPELLRKIFKICRDSNKEAMNAAL